MQSPIDPQQLLEHSGWMRGLALQLLGDAHRADDAVQDAMVAAMESRAGHARNLKSWLGGVLRNQARMTGRGEARRRTREAAVARPEATGGVAESLETFALQRAVVDAVLGLDSPNREIVVLRYFEELPTRQVAQRLQLTTGAVRSRLSRSLESLRASLDASHGGERSRWAPALTAWATHGAREAAATGLGAATWAAAGAAALCAGLLWTLQPGESSPPNAPGPGVLALAPSTPEEASPAAAPAREPSTDTGGLRASSAAAPADPGAAAPADEADLTVYARTIDALGEPLGSIQAQVRTGSRVDSATSDLEGRIRLRVDTSRRTGSLPLRVTFFGPDRAMALRSLVPPASGVANLGDVVLDPGGAVTGRVVDGGGQPIAGQAVFAGLTPEEDPRGMRVRRMGGTITRGLTDVRTAGDGTYTIAGLPAGASVIQARRPNGLYHFTSTIMVVAEQVTQAPDLVLPDLTPGEQWGGTVVSDAGDPLPGVTITLYSEDGLRLCSPATTDDQGQFAVTAPAGEGYLWDLDHPDLGPFTVRDAQPGTSTILRYPQGRWIEVEARARGTSQALEVTARLAGHDRYGRPRWGSKVGENRVRIAIPEDDFKIVVDARGTWKPTVLGPYSPASAPEFVTAWLDPAQGLRGSVLAAGGGPASGAVYLHAVLGSETRQLLGCGLPCRVAPHFTSYGHLDAEGQFHLELPGAGEYELLVETAIDRPMLAQRVSVPGSADVDLGQLQLQSPGSIRGVLLGEAFQLEGAVLATSGDGHLRRTTPGVDGGFELADLQPGTWYLTVGSGGASPGVPSLARAQEDVETYTLAVTVQPGQESQCELDGALAKHSGRARSITGLIDLGPGTRAVRRAVARGRSTVTETAIDSAGRFALRTPEASVSLELSGELALSVRLTLWTKLDLDAPTTHWQYSPLTGAIELAGLPRSEGAPRADFHNVPLRILRVHDATGQDMACSIDLAPGQLDSLLIQGLPVGTYSVREGPAGPHTALTAIPERLRFEVKAGGHTVVPLESE